MSENDNQTAGASAETKETEASAATQETDAPQQQQQQDADAQKTEGDEQQQQGESSQEGEGSEEAASDEEITYHAVEKDGQVTAIWEMQGRKHLRTIDPRSRQGQEILRLYTSEH